MRNFVDQQNYGTHANRVKLNTFCSKEFGNKRTCGSIAPIFINIVARGHDA
jgi:hypothetical protein